MLKVKRSPKDFILSYIGKKVSAWSSIIIHRETVVSGRCFLADRNNKKHTAEDFCKTVLIFTFRQDSASTLVGLDVHIRHVSSIFF